MSNTSVGLITHDIGSSLSRLVARATGHITLIAPFFTNGSDLDRLAEEAGCSFVRVGAEQRMQYLRTLICYLRRFLSLRC